MGQLEENEVAKQHHELCTALNIDATTAMQAWSSYKDMSHHYLLEGSQLHWLGCSLYVSCRKATVPTVNSNRTIEGNLVCLTSLLKQCKMSLNQFLSKCRKWADMCKLPDSFVVKITRLERNFAVSKVIFTKYLPMFKQMFKPPDLDELLMHVRHNKKKMIHATPTKVFEFTWILFVLTKAEYLDVSNDLVDAFHLLIATCDLIYANVIQSKLKDLVNLDFPGMPRGFLEPRYCPPDEGPCIISTLCKHHDGLLMEAKSIKEYCWRNYMSKLLNKQKLRGNHEDLTGLLEAQNFDYNFKVVNKMYEEYILSVGDFDERIFLPKFQSFDEVPSDRALDPDQPPHPSPAPGVPEVDFGIDFTSFRRHVRQMTPRTPLTGRHYLSTRDLEYGTTGNITPVKTATQSVTRLNLLCGRDPTPSLALTRIFHSCELSPQPMIDSVLSELGDKFTLHYSVNADSSRDFAEKRVNVAVCLYYKLLESILIDEQKKPAYDLNILLSLRLFHETLFACCIEIVIFCYNSNRTFPWILSVLNIEPYHFYKVIEVIVRSEASLSRDIVKHLNLSEEQVLDCLAWQSRSSLWQSIENSGQNIPACEQVTLASQLRTPQLISSSASQGEGEEGESGGAAKPLAVSGGGVTPVSDRFQSPVTNKAHVIIRTHSPTRRVIVPPLSSQIRQSSDPLDTGEGDEDGDSDGGGGKPRQREVAQVGGSLGLFFRKLYHLVYVRMEELCSHLRIDDEELKHKIWTCFEYSITHGLDDDGQHIMKDRHVDQLLMSAVYIICKVANSPQYEKTFTEIMKCYRLQPQCNSNVYRSVLLTRQQDGKEERGDLIKFYNMVYVKVMQEFARRFSRSPPPDVLTLSPLPVGRNSSNGSASPFRRVSDKFGLFIRALDHTVFPTTPAGKSNTYCFTRSPAKDLQAINTMIRLDFDSATASALNSHPSSFSGILCRKRPLLSLDPPSGGGPPGKKPSLSGPPNKRLAALVGERQSVLHIAQSNSGGTTTTSESP
uniref:Retinoblastoma-like protein 1 n=1 Tax=Cacopsylla melanoneura TaxID=428564 RepID=A0A8D8SBL7_9HEMI